VCVCVCVCVYDLVLFILSNIKVKKFFLSVFYFNEYNKILKMINKKCFKQSCMVWQGTNNDKIDSDKINFLYTHKSYRHFLKIELYDFFIFNMVF